MGARPGAAGIPRGGAPLILSGLLLYYMGLASCASTVSAPKVSQVSAFLERRGGLFVFRLEAPGATRVVLVGSFNGWNPAAHPLATRDGRLWEVAVALGPGRHVYTFLVDDLPVVPPGAPLYEDDGFGGRNGVIEIP